MIIVGENTYISVSEADTLLQYEFDFDNWDNLTELEKERALVQATRNIDNHFFIGEKYNFEQILLLEKMEIIQTEKYLTM